MAIDPWAGEAAAPQAPIDLDRLVSAYYQQQPDPAVSAERVAFGTSGHRGSSLDRTFNEAHVLAITQAICEHRTANGIAGPLYLGFDTHALSAPAFASALEVLAANGAEIVIAEGDEFTPTPALSHAILSHNADRGRARADGIVITPSHNPPQDGGFKYNPPNGGPADTDVTGAIETRANALLEAGLRGVRRIAVDTARRAPTTHRHDFCDAYVRDLDSVVDIDAIRGAGVKLGVDPLGGAGVHYWGRIAERYHLDLTVVDDTVDPTFAFMPPDWDGKIRMDPSSRHAMRRLIGLKDRFDVAFACDTDHDRHGIVTRRAGLLPANHYLSAAVFYLFSHRPDWRRDSAIAKTVATSMMLDRAAKKLGRPLFEVPVGFKWFVDGLIGGSIAFAGEESAGATFLRRDGRVWTTDKDGIAAALLAGEITAALGRDPAELYGAMTAEFGAPAFDRVEAPASAAQKRALSRLSPQQVRLGELAGEKITGILTSAPGNGAAIGGLKAVTETGWFLARPSGTENIYRVYAESFRGEEALRLLLLEAQNLVDGVTGTA